MMLDLQASVVEGWDLNVVGEHGETAVSSYIHTHGYFLIN